MELIQGQVTETGELIEGAAGSKLGVVIEGGGLRIAITGLDVHRVREVSRGLALRRVSLSLVPAVVVPPAPACDPEAFEMIECESETIQSFGYRAEPPTLRTIFKSGGTYDYFDVPREKFEDMRKANSKGSYHAKHIKKGGYRFERSFKETSDAAQ